MERKRRCGFLEEKAPATNVPVWVRKNLVLFECPKSFVSARSLSYVESYAAWKHFGGTKHEEREAREVDAFAILEGELAQEGQANASENGRALNERRVVG